MSETAAEREARGCANSINEEAKMMGPTVQSVNRWPVVPYLVRISVAKKNPMSS